MSLTDQQKERLEELYKLNKDYGLTSWEWEEVTELEDLKDPERNF